MIISGKTFDLMQWQSERIANGHALLKVTGYDNGDGDGPHWFNLEIDTQSAGDFGSKTNITINSFESLRKLAESFSRAYHKALSIKEDNNRKTN